MTKTYLPTTDHAVTLDASGQILGRLATQIATILRGKNKPTFAPHRIEGDRVIVTNAAAIKVSGRKLEQKMYHRHTGYIGNLRTTTLKDLMVTKPEQVIERAVYGMLPNNRLRKELMKRLTVYPGAAPEKKDE